MDDVATPARDERWARLLHEHRSQARQPHPPRRRPGLVATALVVIVIALGWIGVEQARRSDPSRCDGAFVGERVELTSESGAGTWCVRVDHRGHEIGAPLPAGPVVRSRVDVLMDNASVLLASGSAAVAASLWAARPRRT